MAIIGEENGVWFEDLGFRSFSWKEQCFPSMVQWYSHMSHDFLVFFHKKWWFPFLTWLFGPVFGQTSTSLWRFYPGVDVLRSCAGWSLSFPAVLTVSGVWLTGYQLVLWYWKITSKSSIHGQFFSSMFHSFLKYPEDTGTYRNHFRVRHVLTQGKSLIPPSGCLRWLRSCGTLFFTGKPQS